MSQVRSRSSIRVLVAGVAISLGLTGAIAIPATQAAPAPQQDARATTDAPRTAPASQARKDPRLKAITDLTKAAYIWGLPAELFRDKERALI